MQQPSQDTSCSDLGIPNRLHTLQRTPDSSFTAKEALYRRFSSDQYGTSLSRSIIDTRRMSVNREKYSEEAEDVLYNTVNGKHYVDNGILAWNQESIEQLKIAHPTIEGKYFTFKVIHSPEKCMYPHSHIQPLLDGEAIDKIKPSRVKTILRDKLLNGISHRIVRKPDPTT